MKQAIIITGTPGTGKTTISEKLKAQGYQVIDVGKLVKEDKLYESYDEKRDSYIVSDDVLNEVLIKIVENNATNLPVILDGHIVRLPPQFVSSCIVLRCSVRNLRQRLVERHYDEPKIDENIEAEIMEILLTDMMELYGEYKVKVVWTDGSITETYNKVLAKLSRNSY